MRTLLAAMLLSVSAHAALAQNTPAAAPRVKCIRNLAPKDDTEKNCSAIVTARLEDSISVDVTGYAEWARDGDNKSKPLHLFIEGIELENLTLRYVGRNQDNTDAFWTRLKFGTDDTTDAKVQENRELWSQVLRTARRSDTLALSIGPHGGGQWPTDARIHINSHPRVSASSPARSSRRWSPGSSPPASGPPSYGMRTAPRGRPTASRNIRWPSGSW